MNRRPASPPPSAWRRLFHLIAASIIALLGLAVPEPQYLAIVGALALLSLATDTARLRMAAFNQLLLRTFAPLLKTTESAQLTGATYVLIAAFFAFYFYGGAIAVPALLFLAVGDPISALAGTRAPGPRVWGKSPVGSAAFIAASLTAWAIVAALGYGAWSWAVLIAAIIAALVELMPLPIDDNLTIPLLSGASLLLLSNAGL